MIVRPLIGWSLLGPAVHDYMITYDGCRGLKIFHDAVSFAENDVKGLVPFHLTLPLVGCD